MFTIRKAVLDLFGEGGDGSGAGAAAEGASTSASVTPGGKKGDEYANVVFGKQEGTQAQVEQSDADSGADSGNATEDRRKAYDKLIKGEYKDFYTQDTQRIIDKRFKEQKELEGRLNELSPLVDMLSSKYGVDSVPDIIAKLNDDDSYWEEMADERGLSIEQTKKMVKLERENKAYQQKQQQEINRQRVEAQMKLWDEQAAALKQEFPSFDLDAEIKDDQFQAMLKSGATLKTAYMAMHINDFVNQAASFASASTEKAITDNIRARGTRPVENGASSTSPFTYKSDVNKLTKKDRAEIARRVARGETISF